MGCSRFRLSRRDVRDNFNIIANRGWVCKAAFPVFFRSQSVDFHRLWQIMEWNNITVAD